jgi:hypothetical protein
VGLLRGPPRFWHRSWARCGHLDPIAQTRIPKQYPTTTTTTAGFDADKHGCSACVHRGTWLRKKSSPASASEAV